MLIKIFVAYLTLSYNAADEVVFGDIGDLYFVYLSKPCHGPAVIDEDLTIDFRALSIMSPNHQQFGFGMVCFDDNLHFFANPFLI